MTAQFNALVRKDLRLFFSDKRAVLMSLVARRIVSGFTQFADPRSSPAPHFDGHRSASGGIW